MTEAVTKVAVVAAVDVVDAAVGVRVLVATGTVEKVAASRVEAVLVVAAMAAGAAGAAEAAAMAAGAAAAAEAEVQRRS